MVRVKHLGAFCKPIVLHNPRFSPFPPMSLFPPFPPLSPFSPTFSLHSPHFPPFSLFVPHFPFYPQGMCFVFGHGISL